MSQSPEKEYARRALVHVTIGGHDATGAIAPSLLEFTFTDNAGGKADEVQIELHDRKGHWNSDWKPKKGMAVTASIRVRDWFGPGQDATLPCGTFKIDELEFKGPPDKVSIKAVSSALTTGLRDEARTRAWENSSLQGMAGQVAQEHGLELFYRGDAHSFVRQDQRNESDLSFVNRVAEERAMHCKVHDGKLVIYDKAEAETAAAVLSVARTAADGAPDALVATRYSFKQSSSKTGYNKASVTYADPRQGATHTATVEAAPADDAPRDAKTLALDARVESAGEAMRLGKAGLHNANAKENPASLEFMGHPGVVAGVTLAAVGFGDFSGQYFVRKAEHKVSGSGGYTTSVELTKVRLQADARLTAASREIAVWPRPYPPLPPNTGNATERWEKLFDYLNAWLLQLNCSELEKLLLCLPDIAAAEVARAGQKGNPADAQGWWYLREMFYHWFSGRGNDNADASTEPFWVDWDWVMSFERAELAYAEFTDLIPSVEAQIMNYRARQQIGAILRRNGLLQNRRVDFDFTAAPWPEWRDKYHTLKVVPRRSFPDGLMVALASFSLRALAAGYCEPKLDGGHRIHINKVGVFVYDRFNFAEDGGMLADDLGYWSCEKLEGAKYTGIGPYTYLENYMFRDFRKKYQKGGDFLVLSQPHIVENLKETTYDYI